MVLVIVNYNNSCSYFYLCGFTKFEKHLSTFKLFWLNINNVGTMNDILTYAHLWA